MSLPRRKAAAWIVAVAAALLAGFLSHTPAQGCAEKAAFTSHPSCLSR